MSLNNGLPPPETSPLMDGFLYNPALRFATPYDYYPTALGGLEILRRTALYRPRWYVIPDSINQPIAAYDTLEYQVSLTAGSYLWGYQFTQLVLEQSTFVVVAGDDMLVQITDACTGIPLFSDFVIDFGLLVPSGNALGRPIPNLLPAPRLVLEPGLLNVEIANRSSGSITCQLLLLTAEPCTVMGERRAA
jgi:hypothetical protein